MIDLPKTQSIKISTTQNLPYALALPAIQSLAGKAKA
jgi:hypothetical protein